MVYVCESHNLLRLVRLVYKLLMYRSIWNCLCTLLLRLTYFRTCKESCPLTGIFRLIFYCQRLKKNVTSDVTIVTILYQKNLFAASQCISSNRFGKKLAAVDSFCLFESGANSYWIISKVTFKSLLRFIARASSVQFFVMYFSCKKKG